MDEKQEKPPKPACFLYDKPVIDYLKSLEQQSGQAVQLEVIVRVGTVADSNETSVELCGKLEKRPLRVQRVENLPKQYRDDVALLEGEYRDFQSWQEKIEVLELIYQKPIHYTKAGINVQGQALGMVERRWRLPKPDLTLPFNLFALDREGQDLYGNEGSNLISQKEVMEYFRSQKLKFLEHDYSAKLSGLYARSISAREEIGEKALIVHSEFKVAEVQLKLL